VFESHRGHRKALQTQRKQELKVFTAAELAAQLELKLPNLHQRLVALEAAGVVDSPSAGASGGRGGGAVQAEDLALLGDVASGGGAVEDGGGGVVFAVAAAADPGGALGPAVDGGELLR
jgi:hypothetical protein